MGDANTGTVDEYERLTERHDFLQNQREDLEKGRESLLATIGEIDESTRGVFMETFEAVTEAFSRIFQRLFSGGAPKNILTDPHELQGSGKNKIFQAPAQ